MGNMTPNATTTSLKSPNYTNKGRAPVPRVGRRGRNGSSASPKNAKKKSPKKLSTCVFTNLSPSRGPV